MKRSHHWRSHDATGMNPAQDRTILFFVKYPEPGRVKSRLAQILGPEEASTLYRCFVLDMLGLLRSSGFPFVVCYTPREREEDIVKWLGQGHPYLSQKGRGLGQRMALTFQRIFALGGRQAILIGSDLPDLPMDVLIEAFDALTAHGAVIGPSCDGGYYLIGFRSDAFAPEVFSGIRWGTSSVLRRTLAILEGTDGGTYVLPPWSDVDTIEDLENLTTRIREGGLSAPCTARLLETFSLHRVGTRFIRRD